MSAKWWGLCKHLILNGGIWAFKCFRNFSGLEVTAIYVFTLHSLCSLLGTAVSFLILTHRRLQ
jgi:hypothetical protein